MLRFVRAGGHLCAAAAVLACAVSAQGSVITFTTPSGSTLAGLPVEANVTFTTEANTVIVRLNNLRADPKGVVQNLSDLLFTVSTGQSAGGIISDIATPRWVAAGGGAYTDGNLVSAGWSLSDSNGSLYLNVLGTLVGPAHTIIGPPDGSNLYSNANNSIAGNGPHNPFLAEGVTWTLDVPGVTADSTITSVTFSFGTAPGNDVYVPEPMTAAVLLAGGAMLLARRRRR